MKHAFVISAESVKVILLWFLTMMVVAAVLWVVFKVLKRKNEDKQEALNKDNAARRNRIINKMYRDGIGLQKEIDACSTFPELNGYTEEMQAFERFYEDVPGLDKIYSRLVKTWNEKQTNLLLSTVN